MAKYNTPEEAQAFFNLFRQYGYDHLDTARGYSPHAPGTAEQIMGETDFASWAVTDSKVRSWQPGTHKAHLITESINESLEALKVKSVNTMYLHAPDRETPFEETCRAMNDAYKLGKFRNFGLSNHRADEVDQIVQICKDNNFVLPTVYQGHYNAIARLPEDELLPTLRKHGMAYYAYSPGAAGMLSGKVKAKAVFSASSRWNRDHIIGQMYTSQYHKDALFEAAQKVHEEAQKCGINGHAVALRWVLHHSALRADLGDAMIVGASSLEQLKENLEYCQQGPLPDEIVKVVEEVWPLAKAFAPPAAL